MALPRHAVGEEEKKDEDAREAAMKHRTWEDMKDDTRKGTKVSERIQGRLHVDHADMRHEPSVRRESFGKEIQVAEDPGFPVELEMVSLERLEEEDDEEEEESISFTEAMDCTKSPEATDRIVNATPERPLLTSTSCNSIRTKGWRLPFSTSALPPLPRLNNNNGSGLVISQQVQWGRGGRSSDYSGALSSDPRGPSEQDEAISCPGCCLVGLSFPSVCLRGSAAIPAPRRRASLPRQRPYRNLNGTITGGSASSSAVTTKTLLCHNTNGLVGAGPSVSCEPGRSLPEAQS